MTVVLRIIFFSLRGGWFTTGDAKGLWLISWDRLILSMRAGLRRTPGPAADPGPPDRLMGDLGESDSVRRGDQGDPFSIGERVLNSSSWSMSVPWSIGIALVV
jgi:hypothetical protein